MLVLSREGLLGIVKVLNERIWDDRLSVPTIERWLENFGEDESDRHRALHLLAQFMYFGQAEIREMLRSLYRDLYRQQLLGQVLDSLSSSASLEEVKEELDRQLDATRFLGMGNPSESGTHLLYYFRQENQLSKQKFLNAHEIFTTDRTHEPPQVRLRDKQVQHYVFIDDLCGSGEQAVSYRNDVVADIRRLKPDAKAYYFPLFGLESGLQHVRTNTDFDRVDAVFVLDESFRCFGDDSRYYLPEEQDDRKAAHAMMRRLGARLCPHHPLGYRDSQLLVGFFHNIPDNTLPVIWAEGATWAPLFRRYPKV